MKRENIKHTVRTENGSYVYDHVHIYPQRQITLHQQDSWELSYIITGRGARVVGDTVAPFTEGEILLIPPNIPHCWSFDQSYCDDENKIENITIILPDDFLKGIGLLFTEFTDMIEKVISNKDALFFTGRTLSELQKTMREMIGFNYIDRISPLLTVLQLISSSNDDKSIAGSVVKEDKQSRIMQNILLYIMNNYQDPITLDDISTFCGMAKSSFCVFFKKQTSKSFFAYLTDYRIRISCEMLQKTTMTISEICIASGFRDIPYFHRAFKKQKGMTPVEYRKNHLVADSNS